MIHLNPTLLWYCPNSGTSCHADIFYHINFNFIKGKRVKKYFQVNIIQITKELWQFPLCIKKDKCQTSYYNTQQLQNREHSPHIGKEQTVFLTDFSALRPIWQIILENVITLPNFPLELLNRNLKKIFLNMQRECDDYEGSCKDTQA